MGEEEVMGCGGYAYNVVATHTMLVVVVVVVVYTHVFDDGFACVPQLHSQALLKNMMSHETLHLVHHLHAHRPHNYHVPLRDRKEILGGD